MILRKFLIIGLMLMTGACVGNRRNDFGNSPEKLNAWSGKATIQQLCDGLFEYQDDGVIINRILMEFNRRNVSYLNCHQYNGPK